jgi:hypothetical protein
LQCKRDNNPLFVNGLWQMKRKAVSAVQRAAAVNVGDARARKAALADATVVKNNRMMHNTCVRG